ncbi:hypothetical protein ACFL6I_24075 [candidate division KSB1 bacterium]
MKTRFLFPNSFKKIGWILLVISILLILWNIFFGDISILKNVTIFAIYDSGIPIFGQTEGNQFFKLIQDDFQFEIISIFFITGGLLVSFSKLKNEDEFISKLRLESLVWATYVHFILLFIMILTVYGLIFLNILLINMFTILVLFIIRFHFVLYKAKKGLIYEK